MRFTVIAAALLGLATAASAQTPASIAAPGQTISYNTFTTLWGPGSATVEPFKIVGNVYYVGAQNIASYLITTPEGHILLDTGTTRMQGDLPRNIEKLGFKLSDVKVILASHAHVDHIQSHAIMQRITGALVIAMRDDSQAMATGKDLSATETEGWEPIKIDRIIEDGEDITLGGTVMKAILTPGHTPGSTAWAMTTKEGDRTYQIVFGGPPTPIIGNVKYNTAESLVATSYRRLRELKPDMLLGGHPEAQFRGKIDAMRAGQRPHPLLTTAAAWQQTLDQAETGYKTRLAAAKASGTGIIPGRLPAP